MIKVLVVDDSRVQQELLTYILNSDPEIKVIGTAQDGEEAIKQAELLKPDVITMDLNMPKMNGIEAIRNIMSTHPVPIVVISGSANEMEVLSTFRAIEAGAVSVSEKISYSSGDAEELVNMVKLMSEVKVVRRRAKPYTDKIKKFSKPKTGSQKIEIIVIGGSTGAPVVFQELLKSLPKEFPPVLMVQHISPGFLTGFVEWLRTTTNVNVKIAERGEALSNNTAYLAPDKVHMGIDSFNRITLTPGPLEDGHIPSISYLFRSVSKVFKGNAIGVLLTGMGNDGVAGLKVMKDNGALTLVQDEATSVVYGMPQQAVLNQAETEILSPTEISEYIKKTIENAP